MTYTEKIIDAITGEETLRPYSAQEIAEATALQTEVDAEAAKLREEQLAKDSARQAVLSKLGLTAEEAAALLA